MARIAKPCAEKAFALQTPRCLLPAMKSTTTAAVFNEHLQTKYNHAVNLVKRSFDLYGPEGLAFSFNGGKDSTVILHVLLDAKAQWEADRGHTLTDHQGLSAVHVFFFLGPDEFEEVEAFVRECDEKHQLNVHFYTCPFKAGLQKIVTEHSVKGIFLGSRRGDPNGHDQDFFSPSSEGWPCFMRINPILDWSYHEVWAFLRDRKVHYCALYDAGYTSLGTVSETHPNSALILPDGTFEPAYMLADARLERCGRQDKEGVNQLSESAHCHTASVLIIGDEILSGKVTDKNTPFLARELHKLGWRLMKVTVITDDTDAICRELKSMMKDSEVVITAGGVGPTVDDVTMAAVAKALNGRVTRNPVLEAGLREYFGERVTDAHLKMAEVPHDAALLLPVWQRNGSASPFPVVRIHNTFILPGVPHLLQEKWSAVMACLLEFADAAPFCNRVIRLSIADETIIAQPLKTLTGTFPDVNVGSYPVSDQQDKAGVIISMECKDEGQLDHAMDAFTALMDTNSVSRACVLSVASNSQTWGRSRNSLDIARPV